MKWIKKVATTPLDVVAKVIDNLTQETNNRTNAPSIRAVNEGLANKWADIYPIGSIYLTVEPTFDPSVTFGGTWERIKDRFLLASGDTYTSGNTGGEATHTLTINEMPSHYHKAFMANTADNINYEPKQGYQTAPLVGMNTDINAQTENTGGGAAHNNMPPYLVVNVWKRTA